jgi:hypothetical protein
VKLRGRTSTPDKRRGRILSPGARGAKQLTHHGPLQRLLEDQTAAPTRLSMTTIAAASSVMAIVTAKVCGLRKIAVTINGGLAIYAPSAKQRRDTIRRQRGSAERNRRTPVSEEASDRKDDSGERNQPGHNGPLTVKLRGRAPRPDGSRGCTLSYRTRGDTTESHGPLQRLLDRSCIRNPYRRLFRRRIPIIVTKKLQSPRK